MYIVKDSFQNRAAHFGQPILSMELELGSAAVTGALEQVEQVWSTLDQTGRHHLIADLHLHCAEAPVAPAGFLVMPGGSLAVHLGSERTLVCDPLAVAIVSDSIARRLRERLSGRRRGLVTISHNGAGLVSRHGLPESLSGQTVTIIQDVAPYAGLIPQFASGPVLISWRDVGAIAWAMTPAPTGLALIAAIAGNPVGDSVLLSHRWSAATLADRAEAIALPLHQHVSDLLAGDATDDLRWALCRRAVSGANALSHRLAIALQVLPVHFTPDGLGLPGDQLLEAWPIASNALQKRHALAMLGIRRHTDCLTTLRVLRDVLNDEGLFVLEHPHSDQIHPAILGRPAAENLAAEWSGPVPCAALVVPPADPSALFALGHRLAERLDAEVTIAAPDWGFFHRIDARSGADAGNAAWFGLGAALDDLEWI